VKTKLILVTTIKSILVTGLLIGEASVAQSTVVVSEIRFDGELGVPVSELQEYTQFLKGHSLEKEKVLEQSSSAVSEALRRRGFLKAQVTPSLPAAPDSSAARKGAILLVTVHAEPQYRLKDVSFAGRASEFSAGELRDAIHLRQGDIAYSNEIGTGIANLMALFKRKGQDYFVVPATTFDDAAHTVSVTFDIQK
jgi:outer membrane protein assembly factor BamA